MNTEQAQQIAQAMETAVTKNIVDAINKQSNNKNISSNNVLIIIALFAAILGMGVWANSKLNQVISSNADTASAVAVGIEGVTGQVGIVIDEQYVIKEKIDNVQSSVDKVQASVNEIPTKPVVITKPSKKDYDKCIKWVKDNKLEGDLLKLWLDMCKGYLK
jgi:hypothetical protein